MGVIIGLDYGERRIGVAVSDPDEIVATPLQVISVTSARAALEAVERCCHDKEAERLVVGIPYHLDGRLSPMGEQASRFAARLAEHLKIPVETWDERFTTKIAESVLIEAGTSRKKRKGVVDKLAAQIMLQHFLDSRGEIGPSDLGNS